MLCDFLDERCCCVLTSPQGKYVKYFYSKLFSVSQLAGFNLGDVQAHLQLAQWVEQHGVPDADEDIEELFDGFFNKVDLKVHSHKYRQGGWPKADIWCHMKFLDNMQTMASNIHATTVVINLNVMPVSLYVTVDPNDPNENYHYTLSVNDVRSETSNHGALFITVNCTTGTRKQIFEDGDMGPAEECAIDPLEVTISVVWKGPSDDFRKRC